MTEIAGPFTVRPAELADAPGLAIVQVRSWQAAYPGIVPDAILRSLSVKRREVEWRHILGEDRSQTYVAVVDGEIAGWISVGRSRDADATASTGELWGIYVDPGHWRRGAGHALWARGGPHLAAAGFAEVTLWVFRDNVRAQRFYRGIGFAADGAGQAIDFDGISVPEIRFRRRLEAP